MTDWIPGITSSGAVCRERLDVAFSINNYIEKVVCF